MKRFTFELEQLLRLKRWKEEEAKKALAVEVAALERLKERLMQLQGELKGMWDNDTGGAGEMVDANGRLNIIHYARHMGTLIAGQEGDIAGQAVRLKEKSDLLMKAMQERKVLEKLRERRQLEWRHERNKKEYANLDEASASYLRRLVDGEKESREPGAGGREIIPEPPPGTSYSRLPAPDSRPGAATKLE
jgi:flagellar FliJ protein